MKPQSMTHKILARQAGQDWVEAGEIVEARISMCFAHDPVMDVLGKTFYAGYGDDARVWDPARIALVQDHLVPAKDAASRNLHKAMQTFVDEQGVEHFFPYGGAKHGVCHNVLIENGLILPGELVVGTDSHTVTAGAFNALGTGVGMVDMASVFGTGRLWFTVPHVMSVALGGSLPEGVEAMDVMLRLLSDIKMDGASGMAIEWSGSAMEQMTLDQRTTLCNMVVEAGAMTGIMSVSPETDAYLRPIAKRDYTSVMPDPDFVYDDSLVYDAETIEPMVALPGKPDNGVPISHVRGERVPVNQVYVGGCAGGKLEDIKRFADVLRTCRVSDRVQAIVVPATKAIFEDLVADGTALDLVRAGAVMESPGCKACFGAHGGVLGDGDVCLATINRNFRGRMGSPSASVYLGSPTTAGHTALRGYITNGR